jgi:cell division septation protein DedD
LNLSKFWHTNKGFFILSLVAAVAGLVISFLFSGCSRSDQPSRVIVSKRVKIDVKDITGTGPEALTVQKRKRAEASSRAGGLKTVSKGTASGGSHESVTAGRLNQRHKSAAKPIKHRKKRPPLKTLRKSWVVNVASFTRTSDAERLKKRLTNAGYSAYITKFTKAGILYYRVRVGFYLTADKARRSGRVIASDFRNVGSPWVAKPDMDEILNHSK